MAKITKNMCRNFLNKVEMKALGSIDSKYIKLKREALEKDIEKYSTIKNLLIEAGNKITEAKGILENVHQEIVKEGLYQSEEKNRKKSVFDALYYNTNLVKYLGYMSKDDVSLHRIISDLSGTLNFENYQKVCKEYYKERKEVSKNYSIVREELNSAKSGKQCHQILVDLGFDTSSIEKEVESKTIKEVDKSKLFVCGETK